MIDFRYHLVSLVSVFLALAIGVVLGAGPLRDTIGATLEDQVQALRQDKGNLQEAVADRDALLGRRKFRLQVLHALHQRVRAAAVAQVLGQDARDAVQRRIGRHDHVGRDLRQVVGEAALALVTPLGADDHCSRHDRSRPVARNGPAPRSEPALDVTALTLGAG